MIMFCNDFLRSYIKRKHPLLDLAGPRAIISLKSTKLCWCVVHLSDSWRVPVLIFAGWSSKFHIYNIYSCIIMLYWQTYFSCSYQTTSRPTQMYTMIVKREPLNVWNISQSISNSWRLLTMPLRVTVVRLSSNIQRWVIKYFLWKSDIESHWKITVV